MLPFPAAGRVVAARDAQVETHLWSCSALKRGGGEGGKGNLVSQSCVGNLFLRVKATSSCDNMY